MFAGKTAVVAGAGRNIGLAIVRRLLVMGWTVHAGLLRTGWEDLAKLQQQYPGKLFTIKMDTSQIESVNKAAIEVSRNSARVDMLIYNAAVFGNRTDDIYTEVDFDSFLDTYNVNCLGAIRMVEAFLPLMEGGMKRLSFVSSEAGANSVASRTRISSYSMSKTALSMAIRIMFNDLQPKGWSFRIFHPGWVRSVKPDKGIIEGIYEPDFAGDEAVKLFCSEYSWEDRLVMLDIEGRAWPC